MATQTAKKILIVEDTPEIRRIMEYSLQSGGYELISVESGTRALEVITSFSPDLIMLDIMLPGIEGLDVLKAVKANPLTRHIGVIICSGKQHKADIETALRLGANDYILKPFEMDQVAAKVTSYFSQATIRTMGTSFQPSPQEGKELSDSIPPKQAYLKFWGCRGSSPVAGKKYLRYGGNTPCVEIKCGDETLIIDAGTGIRELGMHLLERNSKRIHLFIGHTHWDHIQGFPFFGPVYRKNQELFIYGAAGHGKDLKSAFSGLLASEYFPVQLEDMKAKMTFVELEANPVFVGSVPVYWEYVHHSGAALGFKLIVNGQSIVYITDNEFLKGYTDEPYGITIDNPILDPYRALLSFIDNVDILICEAQYLNEEYVDKIGWGHSSLNNGCLLAKLGKVKSWIVTHYEPMHDDQLLDQKLIQTRQILKKLDAPIEVSHAFDGLMLLL